MHSPTKRSAFTLVEMLIVVAIIGIIGAFAVPAVKSMLRGSSLTTGANMLADEVALARQHALTKSRIVEFRIYRFGDPEVPGESVATPKTGHFRAFQFFEVSDNGAILPTGKFKRLPDGIIMNSGILGTSTYNPADVPTLSSLLGEAIKFNVSIVLSAALKDTDPELPRGVKKSYDYVSFLFMPDGSTNLSPAGRAGSPSEGGKWYVTLHSTTDLVISAAGNVTGTKLASGSGAAAIKGQMDFITWMIDPVSGTSKLLRPGLK